MSSRKPSVIIISAPSGAGKTTLCSRLLETYSDSLMLSISCTTRTPRGQEKEGDHYFFLTREGFQKKIDQGEFAEWALVHGEWYGTLKSTIEKALNRGRSTLLDIDVQGAEKLRTLYPGKSVSIFISPPSLDELEKRLRVRGTESDEKIRRRIENARLEMKEAPKFDHVLINDDLDRAFNELKTVIGEKLRE